MHEARRGEWDEEPARHAPRNVGLQDLTLILSYWGFSSGFEGDVARVYWVITRKQSRTRRLQEWKQHPCLGFCFGC